MHEISIMQSLFSRLESLSRQHGASRVVSAAVEVGEFSNVVPELLKQAFNAFREVEPLLAEARLEIRWVPLEATCRRCEASFRPQPLGFRCPKCGLADDMDVKGEDLVLRDVELEIPDPHPPAKHSRGRVEGQTRETEPKHA